MAVLWQPCGAGARILRVLGDSPCPVLPDCVDGRPVTELGPYCFSARPVEGGLLWPADSDETHEVTGDFLEEVVLPDSLRILHSAAFYNCHRLRRVEAGPNLESLGSDLFTNCRALRTFALRAAPDAETGLKKLLGAVSADVGVEFLGEPGATLFYPEYFEWLDENTPAHIFNHSIEGEGYRMRQCFAGGMVDYSAYDATFAQTCVGESEEKLCRMALARLLAPFALSENARADYEFYLTGHPDAAFALAIAERREAALRLLVGLGLDVREAAARCARAGWSAGATILLARPKRAAKQYDFDDL
ncbi:leucine-rich repeat protein [uncultured Subdoligranulum sp.]|uniref:leucine-rich repeat protein n=1 Tax=uncultured Subdoligranulum sp. TaxID=512298 RepID=UPI0026275C3B|nr:leucine-rich repeat protein [uncultured Subdoligranulum sp.]